MNWVYGNEQVVFTADTHAFHANIIKYCNRPFSCVDDMNIAMANNINLVLAKGGFLYHLGDWSFGHGRAQAFRDMIRPDINIILIFGNHDVKSRKDRNFTSLFSDVFDMLDRKINGQHIVMCHYAMRTWCKMHYGTWHCFGHSHGTLPIDYTARSMDVGVDTHDFRPYTFNEVKQVMENERTWKPIDHHQ